MDVQPAHPSQGNIVVLVTGQLLIDDETNPQQFSQMFHLFPDGPQFWVFNDVFRLNYG